jgi:hypothetical protein
VVSVLGCSPIQPTQSINQQVFGTLEVSFDASKPSIAFKSNQLQAASYLPDNAFQVTRVLASGAIEDATQRVIFTRFEFLNKTTANFTNFTLYAYNQAANNIGGTAYKNIRNESDVQITDTQIVRSIHPSHGMQLVANSLEVDTARADFQAFRRTESEAIESAAKTAGSIGINDDVLEVGYVARSTSGGRVIAPNATGEFTLAVIVPKRSDSLTPRRAVGTYVLANEPITRVSRSFEESASLATARFASTANATELALIYPESNLTNLPGTLVNLKAVKLYAPTSTPVISGGEATFGPEGGYLRLGEALLQVEPGSVSRYTRFKIESLPSPPSAFPNPALQNVGTYRLSASTTVFNSPPLLLVPANSAGVGDTITELYSWNGLTFTKEQIGTTTSSFGAFVKGLSTQNPPVGFAGSLTYSIGRATTTTLASACQAQNGVFNGMYCELPLPALVQQQATARSFKFMSFNAGNAFFAGEDPTGNAFAAFCLPYQVKLCSFADEERARQIIAGYQPDILAIQEVWHNYCNYNQGDTQSLINIRDALANYTRNSSMPINPTTVAEFRVLEAFYADRVCSRPNLTSTQMGRIAGHGTYAIRCTIAQDGVIPNRIINGYECTAVRRSSPFEFVDPWTNGDGPTRGQEQISSRISFACTPTRGSDTGFQIERLRLRDPRGPLTSIFELANAHLASPGEPQDLNGVCQANQLSALYNRQVSSTRKSLVVGDFNIDTVPTTIVNNSLLFGQSSTVLNRVTTPINTAFDAEIKSTAAWSFVSDPNEDTTELFGFGFGLDHVLSNFATGSCVRGARVSGFDHLFTTCTLTGFESGTGSFDLKEQLLDYPPPGTPNPIANPLTVQQVLFGFSRKGVQLNYPTFLPRVSGSGRWQLALPDVPIRALFYNQRCNSERQTLNVNVLTDEVLPYANVVFQTPQSGPARFPRTQPHTNWCI